MNVSLDSRPPKYRQLVERFRSQMQSGALRPGDRLPSLKEMREDEGLSRPTVEKAYSLLERDGLIERLHGAGVFVCEPKRKAEKRPVSRTIGLSGGGFGCAGVSPYWSELMGGAREAASSAGFDLLLLDSKINNGWEKADGVLVCDWNDAKKPRKEVPGMPLVSLRTPIRGVASVFADDEGGAHDATEFLLGLGHQKIAFLHGYDDHAVVHNRLSGYRSALREAGIAPDPRWMRCLRGSYDLGQRFTTEARKNMLLWLRDDWRELGCTALLCHNDEAAAGAIAALQEAEIRVPDEVSVVGFDGTEYCDWVQPALSSVELPLRKIGAAGVELLLQQIQSEQSKSEHRVLEVQLRERKSTIAPPHR